MDFTTRHDDELPDELRADPRSDGGFAQALPRAGQVPPSLYPDLHFIRQICLDYALRMGATDATRVIDAAKRFEQYWQGEDQPKQREF